MAKTKQLTMGLEGVNTGLDSDNQLEVALVLTDMQFDAIRAKDADMADRLKALREKVWADGPTDKESRDEVFKKALEGLGADKDRIRLLMESYSRMGELYEVAGLTARDNLFKHLEEQGEQIPKGVADFVDQEFKRGGTIDSTLAKLSVPVFEPILTMHPTNVQGPAPIKALREVALATRDRKKLAKAIANYQDTPILNKTKDGTEGNLTVRDETQTVLFYLNNIYNDTPAIFKQYDDALRAKAKEKKEKYDPLKLKLDARFGSWGSAGDKDGNDNVTAEKTLEAIARHTHEIVGRYLGDLNSEELKGMESPELAKLRNDLGEVDKKLAGLVKKAALLTDAADKLREPIKALDVPAHNEESAALNKRFKELSAEIKDVRDTLKIEEFDKSLVDLHKNADGEAKEKLLEIIRKERWFGFNFAKIEYRETAEEYEKVIERLDPQYKKLEGPEARAKYLENLLSGNELPKAIKDEADKVISDGTSKSLKDSRNEKKVTVDATAIAYHSLKRMELARDFPDMIKDSVLAECGTISREKEEPQPTAKEVAAQGAANMMEALLLQRLTDQEANKQEPAKKAMLGIVPLFEDPSTMENIGAIMKAVYDSKPYRKHMNEVSELRHEKPTQQVQIAHSDNRRRAGSLGGTGLIHDAHKIVRKLNDEYGIKTQFFEGGSLSDPFRNGVRAISAQVNAFGMHDFAKFTFQGRDMMNYFNHPGSNERVFTRQFVHPAKSIVNDPEQGWIVNRKGDGQSKGDANGEDSPDSRIPNAVVDDIAVEALKRTLDDYKNDEFTVDRMGVIAAMIGAGYKMESVDANWGARAAFRGGDDKSNPTTTHMGTAWTVDLEKGVRTIPFSQIWQQNMITPSWIGGLKLKEYIQDETVKRIKAYKSGNDPEGYFVGKDPEEVKKAMEELESVISERRGIQAKHMKYLFDKSPTLRDAFDKAAFAVARTDMVAVKADLEPKLQPIEEDDPARNIRKDSEEVKKIKSDGRAYLEHLAATYNAVGDMVFEAQTGKERRTADNIITKYQRYSPPDVAGHANMQASALVALNGLGEDIARQTKFMDFVTFAKADLGRRGLTVKDPDAKKPNNLLPVVLAAGQAGVYTRFLKADDPGTYQHESEQAQAMGR